MSADALKGAFAATQSQKLIWAGQELAGDVPLYNMAWRFDLLQSIDPKRFEDAFRAVLAKCDALTLCLTMQGDGLVNAPGSAAFDLEVVDLGGDEAQMEAWLLARSQQAFALGERTYDTALLKVSADHWVWYFAQHHIATDAWSGSLIYNAVSAAYAGTETSLCAYADSAADLSGGDPEAVSYWRALKAQHKGSSVPYGRSRDERVAASHRRRVAFGADRLAALQALETRPEFGSISPDLTRFAIFATAYAAFLHRVTGDETIWIGAPAHNRGSFAAKATPGLFIELFPLAIHVDGTKSLTDLYAQVLAEAFDYLRHAKPGASSADTAAMFNSVLNYMPVRYGDFAGGAAKTTWLHAGAHDPAQNIRLHVYDFDGQGDLVFEMDFNNAVFDAALSSSAVDQFGIVLDAMVSTPEQAIADVAIGSSALSIQTGPKGRANTQTVLDRIFTHADGVALDCEGETLAYAELVNRVDLFAGKLAALGVVPGDTVVLRGRRSADLVVALLGIMRAGAAFVPLPEDTSDKRLAQIVQLAQPRLAVLETAADIGCAATDMALGAVKIDAPMPTLSGAAYTIFTSGSTGTPKGVVVGHDGLARYVGWAARSFGPTGPQSWPLFSAIGFDLTITSIFASLITGGTLVIYPEDDGVDTSVLRVFEQDRVDVVKLTPSHLALVTAHGEAVSTIGTLVLGGENLTAALCRDALKTLSPSLTIFNEYGPTEAVVGCMIHRFDPASDTDPSVPIGTPADDIAIYVLDAYGHPVADGMSGEIYIGGRLAHGYLGQDALTRDRFLPDPFAGEGCMYKSGDLARVGPDGCVAYLGRGDDQIKVRGVRIEPAEIEAEIADVTGAERVFVTLLDQRPVSKGLYCKSCGLDDSFPDADIDDSQVCSICREFEGYRGRADAYFRPERELTTLMADLQERKTGKYDVISLLSGGKDSTYALYRLAELKPNILALTLDNGFLSPEAKDNIKRVVDSLGIDHRFLTTPAMNEIFVDSLKRHANVCQGCFKTIYALALEVAREEGIPAIATGLSRGQFFETRLTPELFFDRKPSIEELDAYVLDARKHYHKLDDAIARLLKTETFITDQLLDEVEFIDIYRYIDVPVQELYDFLDQNAPWVRPSDTGRSTNCLINDVGIWMHKERTGFHNYALPYSWDVRMGHKTVEEAKHELNDEIDPSRITQILQQIGYDGPTGPDQRAELVAYVQGPDTGEAALRAKLRDTLPPQMVPDRVMFVDHIALTTNGKVDTDALPVPVRAKPEDRVIVAPSTDAERVLIEVFESVLDRQALSVTDNFFELGGDSIQAIQVQAKVRGLGFTCRVTDIFRTVDIRDLAMQIAPAVAQAPAPVLDPIMDLESDDMAALAAALGQAAE